MLKLAKRYFLLISIFINAAFCLGQELHSKFQPDLTISSKGIHGGTAVVITGTSLTGATSVSFGGVKAITFTVDSDTQITATVPTGAKTGKIQVKTAGGSATSATSFTVLP